MAGRGGCHGIRLLGLPLRRSPASVRPGHGSGAEAWPLRRRHAHAPRPQLLLDRINPSPPNNMGWAGGGWIGYETGWFYDAVSFGVVGYLPAAGRAHEYRRHAPAAAGPARLHGARPGLGQAAAPGAGVHRLPPAHQPAGGQSAGQPDDAQHLRGLHPGRPARRLQLLRGLCRGARSRATPKEFIDMARVAGARRCERGHGPARRHLRAGRQLQGARLGVSCAQRA